MMWQKTWLKSLLTSHRVTGIARSKTWFVIAKRIDKIWDKIFFFGTGFDCFFFVFDDDFVIGNLGNFFAGNSECGVNERFDDRTPDNYLLDDEIVVGNCIVGNFAEFAAFFGFNFEAGKGEIEF